MGLYFSAMPKSKSKISLHIVIGTALLLQSKLVKGRLKEKRPSRGPDGFEHARRRRRRGTFKIEIAGGKTGEEKETAPDAPTHLPPPKSILESTSQDGNLTDFKNFGPKLGPILRPLFCTHSIAIGAVFTHLTISI